MESKGKLGVLWGKERRNLGKERVERGGKRGGNRGELKERGDEKGRKEKEKRRK